MLGNAILILGLEEFAEWLINRILALPSYGSVVELHFIISGGLMDPSLARSHKCFFIGFVSVLCQSHACNMDVFIMCVCLSWEEATIFKHELHVELP